MNLTGRCNFLYGTVAVAKAKRGPIPLSALELYFRPTFNILQDEQCSQGTVRP
jgi:hypothetical protein